MSNQSTSQEHNLVADIRRIGLQSRNSNEFNFRLGYLKRIKLHFRNNFSYSAKNRVSVMMLAPLVDNFEVFPQKTIPKFYSKDKKPCNLETVRSSGIFKTIFLSTTLLIKALVFDNKPGYQRESSLLWGLKKLIHKM